MAAGQSISIRLFVSVRKFYHMLALDPSHRNLKWKWQLNGKNLFIFYLQLQMFISTIAFGLYEAKTVFEYGTSAFVSVSELGSFICYLLQLLKIANILDLFSKMDKLIEKSK